MPEPGSDLAESPTPVWNRELAVPSDLFEAASLAAISVRAKRKGHTIRPYRAVVFALPEENDLTHELVLKVFGAASALKTVLHSKPPGLGGLFEDEPPEEVTVRVNLGDDWLYLWEDDLPPLMIERVLSLFPASRPSFPR